MMDEGGVRKEGDSLSVKEEGSSDLGSDLDPWIRQNDADRLDPDLPYSF